MCVLIFFDWILELSPGPTNVTATSAAEQRNATEINAPELTNVTETSASELTNVTETSASAPTTEPEKNKNKRTYMYPRFFKMRCACCTPGSLILCSTT
jgi:hypothetical protein